MDTMIPETVEAYDVAELYEDPALQRLIDATIDKTLGIVAAELGVKCFTHGDGAEDFWGDVHGSVVDLLRQGGIDTGDHKPSVYAVAPDLLKACRMFVSGGGHTHLCRTARARRAELGKYEEPCTPDCVATNSAIAKAEGRPT